MKYTTNKPNGIALPSIWRGSISPEIIIPPSGDIKSFSSSSGSCYRMANKVQRIWEHARLPVSSWLGCTYWEGSFLWIGTSMQQLLFMWSKQQFFVQLQHKAYDAFAYVDVTVRKISNNFCFLCLANHCALTKKDRDKNGTVI